MLSLAMLCAASVLTFTAIMRRSEALLLVSVVAYAGTAVVIVMTAPELLPPVAALAAALAVTGLVRFLAGWRARDPAAPQACSYADSE